MATTDSVRQMLPGHRPSMNPFVLFNNSCTKRADEVAGSWYPQVMLSSEAKSTIYIYGSYLILLNWISKTRQWFAGTQVRVTASGS